jgi:hypothetical protein
MYSDLFSAIMWQLTRAIIRSPYLYCIQSLSLYALIKSSYVNTTKTFDWITKQIEPDRRNLNCGSNYLTCWSNNICTARSPRESELCHLNRELHIRHLVLSLNLGICYELNYQSTVFYSKQNHPWLKLVGGPSPPSGISNSLFCANERARQQKTRSSS